MMHPQYPNQHPPKPDDRRTTVGIPPRRTVHNSCRLCGCKYTHASKSAPGNQHTSPTYTCTCLGHDDESLPATVDPPTPKRGGRRIAVGVAHQPVPPNLGVGGGATSVWPYDHPVQFCKLGTGPLSQFDHGRAQGVKRTHSFPNRWSALPVAFRCFVHGRCHYQIQHWARTGSNGG